MRIALLSYRSKTHCGGQGVYVRHLSRGLVELGHDVEVFSGPALPRRARPEGAADQGAKPGPLPRARSVPHPAPQRDHDRIDLLELLATWTAGFPGAEDLLPARGPHAGRAPRRVRRRPRQPEPRAPGCSTIAGVGLPVVATVHHPITRDRVLDVAAAKWWRKPLVRRWYGFAEMQKQVARKLPELLTVSSTSATDIAEDFGVSARPAARRAARRGHRTVPAGSGHRVRNRIIAIASADVPLKGVSHLLHAVARLRVERDLELQLVAKLEPNGPTEKLIAELGISDIVHSSSGLYRRRTGRACWPRLKWRAFPRCTRASRCPPWRRWPAARRSSPAGQVRCPRWSASTANARGWSTRRRRRADSGARRTARLADGAAQARRQRADAARVDVFSWESVAAQTVAVYERACERVQNGHMLTVDFDRLGVGPGTKVIDVGCGAGRHTFEAFRRGADVVGVRPGRLRAQRRRRRSCRR